MTAFEDAPRPDAFAEYRGYPPETMKQQFLAPALTAWLDNRGRLVRKGRLINATFYLAGALAVLVIVVRLFQPGHPTPPLNAAAEGYTRNMARHETPPSATTAPPPLPPKGSPLPAPPPNSIDYLGRGAPRPLNGERRG